MADEKRRGRYLREMDRLCKRLLLLSRLILAIIFSFICTDAYIMLKLETCSMTGSTDEPSGFS